MTAGAILDGPNLGGLILADGYSPSNDDARRWLVDELSRPQYADSKPGLLDRFGNWLIDLLDRAVSGLGSFTDPLPSIVGILVLVALVALGIYLLRYVRRGPRSARGTTEGVLGSRVISADEYRDRAEQALTAGHAGAAVLDAMRAIARRSVERTLLPESPSMTAHEVAVRLAQAFPDVGGDLAVAADLFDGVAYGHGTATTAQARAVLDLDHRIRTARPATADEPLTA